MTESDQYRLAVVEVVTVGGREGIVLARGQNPVHRLPGECAGVEAKHGFSVAVGLYNPAIIINPYERGVNDCAGGVRSIALNQEFFHSACASSGSPVSGDCPKVVILLFFTGFATIRSSY